jgi:hypothetical protein
MTLGIVKLTPTYFNGSGMEWIDYVYPYADLQMAADFGNGNTGTFYLRCPILSPN